MVWRSIWGASEFDYFFETGLAEGPAVENDFDGVESFRAFMTAVGDVVSGGGLVERLALAAFGLSAVFLAVVVFSPGGSCVGVVAGGWRWFGMVWFRHL